MNCPVCNVQLQLAERQGIEIDYCPQCRGVWLDRGELDKIIERSPAEYSSTPPTRRDAEYSSAPPRRENDDRDYNRRPGHKDYDDDHSKDHYKRRKRGGFLGELFDFD